MRNRQIKFRVWDKFDRWFVWSRSYKIGLEGGLYYKSDKLYDRYIRQQWTGLVDKDGVDIYEGDIVGFDSEHEMIAFRRIFDPEWKDVDLSRIKGEIKWEDGGLRLFCKQFGRCELSEFVCCEEHNCGLIVVGNIFET